MTSKCVAVFLFIAGRRAGFESLDELPEEASRDGLIDDVIVGTAVFLIPDLLGHQVDVEVHQLSGRRQQEGKTQKIMHAVNVFMSAKTSKYRT